MRLMKRWWPIFIRGHRSRGSRDRRPHLVISQSVCEFIEAAVQDSSGLETGGILMGPASPDPNTVIVTKASGAGPNAKRSPGAFIRDTAYCSLVLRNHYERFGVDYVGEWHSHLGGPPGPSAGDLATLMAIMRDPDYQFQAFAMLLAVVLRRRGVRPPGVELIGVVATRSATMCVPVEVRPVS